MIEITYSVPLERIEQVLPEHRNYMRTGYTRGILLCSGPMQPRIGGILFARAESREQLDEFLSRDPYIIQNVATHRIVEFLPVLHQEWLTDWLAGE